MRPLLKIHGGKWRIAPWIISFFPEHRIYVEPFGGGASVLLRKQRSEIEIYNDLDREIVNLFRMARDRGDDLIRAVFLTPFAREEFNSAYDHKDEMLKTAAMRNFEGARRLLIRSYMGFSSSSIFKSSGFKAKCLRSWTTAAQDWQRFPSAIREIICRRRGVIIENRNAFELMKSHDAEDVLFYLDPPYLAETRNPGRDYRYEMSADRHIELSKFLGSLKGAIILSGYESDLYKKLYSKWRCEKYAARADGARKRIECLWLKNIKSAPLIKDYL